jgi:CDP-diglyceride synthetase
MFALDSFSPNLTIWQQIGAFLIHLIPSFILLAFLLVAWKWELIGGILFTVIGLAATPFIYLHNYRMNQSVWMSLMVILFITIPFVIVGVLFTISHFKNRNQMHRDSL